MKNKDKFVSTKRNKGLEPMGGSRFIIGYNSEIHSDDALEFSYKLPLGAIKRLIESYYKDIQLIDSSGVYCGNSGSWEIRMHPYCYRMIANLRKQLYSHGFNGEEIDDEVFDQYFKADYEKMKRFSKNHGNDVMEGFKRCDDPECCKPLTKREKVIDLPRVFYFMPSRWIWEYRRLKENFKDNFRKHLRGGGKKI